MPGEIIAWMLEVNVMIFSVCFSLLSFSSLSLFHKVFSLEVRSEDKDLTNLKSITGCCGGAKEVADGG